MKPALLAVTEWIWLGPVLVLVVALAAASAGMWLLWLAALVGFVCDAAIYVWAKLTRREPWDSWFTRVVREFDG